MEALDKSAQTRPRRGLGRAIAALIHCPLCQTGGMTPEWTEMLDGGGERWHEADVSLENHGYRATGVRLGCPRCGLRFLVPIEGDYGLGAALERIGDKVLTLRAARPLYALELEAAIRLEERGRDEGLDELVIEAEAMAQVARRLRNAETRSQRVRET